MLGLWDSCARRRSPRGAFCPHKPCCSCHRQCGGEGPCSVREGRCFASCPGSLHCRPGSRQVTSAPKQAASAGTPAFLMAAQGGSSVGCSRGRGVGERISPRRAVSCKGTGTWLQERLCEDPLKHCRCPLPSHPPCQPQSGHRALRASLSYRPPGGPSRLPRRPSQFSLPLRASGTRLPMLVCHSESTRSGPPAHHRCHVDHSPPPCMRAPRGWLGGGSRYRDQRVRGDRALTKVPGAWCSSGSRRWQTGSAPGPGPTPARQACTGGHVSRAERVLGRDSLSLAWRWRECQGSAPSLLRAASPRSERRSVCSDRRPVPGHCAGPLLWLSGPGWGRAVQ